MSISTRAIKASCSTFASSFVKQAEDEESFGVQSTPSRNKLHNIPDNDPDNLTVSRYFNAD